MQQAATLSGLPRGQASGGIGDPIFAGMARASGVFVLLLLGSIILSLFIGGLPAFRRVRRRLSDVYAWDPVRQVFGAGVSVYGTLLTSVLALILSVRSHSASRFI